MTKDGLCVVPTASTAGLKILQDEHDSAAAAATAAAPSIGDIPAVVDEALFLASPFPFSGVGYVVSHFNSKPVSMLTVVDASL